MRTTRKDIFTKVLKLQKGYKVGINGGESYKGISRRHNPSWEGWRIIDILKQSNNGVTCLKVGDITPIKGKDWQKRLETMVITFYKAQYWDVVEGDKISFINYALACELFDSAVLLGVKEASKLLQNSINKVIVNKTLDVELLVVDGKIGSKTMKILRKVRAFINSILSEFIKELINLDKKAA